jgi:MFS family permease
VAIVAENKEDLRESATDLTPAVSPQSPNEEDYSSQGGFVAFESRQFTLYWAALAFSLTGVWVRITAQGWLVYELTEDRLLLGVVSFCQAAPVLICAPFAGAILDRVDRRKILLVVQISVSVAMFVLATLTATDRIEVWQIAAVAAFAGGLSAFDWPARLSMVPSLVNRQQLKSAVALNSAAFNASRVLGPVIGGLLIAVVGAAACFYINAVTYIPFILVLASMAVDRTLPATPRSERKAIAELKDGYRYIWHTPNIRGLLSIDIVPLAFGFAYLTLMPAYAKDVLDVGGGGLGVLQAANGVGALFGTLLVATLTRIRRRGLIVIGGVGIFGFGVILLGMSSNFYVAVGIVLLIGLTLGTYGTMNDTLVQTLVNNAYRGRVIVVYSTLWGLTPIGSLQAGYIARTFGIGEALVLNGFLVILYVPILLLYTPVKSID